MECGRDGAQNAQSGIWPHSVMRWWVIRQMAAKRKLAKRFLTLQATHPSFPRQALHAAVLGLDHPVTGTTWFEARCGELTPASGVAYSTT